MSLIKLPVKSGAWLMLQSTTKTPRQVRICDLKAQHKHPDFSAVAQISWTWVITFAGNSGGFYRCFTIHSRNVALVITTCESEEEKEEGAGKRMGMTLWNPEIFVFKEGRELEPQPEQSGWWSKAFEKSQKGPSTLHTLHLLILPLVGHFLPLSKAVSTWNISGVPPCVNDSLAVLTTCSASLCPLL